MPGPRRKPQSQRPAGGKRGRKGGGAGGFLRWLAVLLMLAATFAAYYSRDLWVPRWQAWHAAPAPAAGPPTSPGAPANPAAGSLASAACGSGRLQIANLADAAGAGLLHAAAQAGTLPQLAALPRPAGVDDATAPRRGAEDTVWRVPAELTGYQLDAAQSLVLWLRAPGQPEVKLRAVIPVDHCTSNSAAGDLFSELREDIGLRFGEPAQHLTTLSQPIGITLTGPAYFGTAAAGDPANGVEVRPVLNFTVP